MQKSAPHPWRTRDTAPPTVPIRPTGAVDYAELWTTSSFSFLEGASSPEELVRRAHAFGHRGIAACDRASLAGAVRYHAAAKEFGLPLAIGARIDARARLDLEPDGWGSKGPSARHGQLPLAPPPLLLFATDRASYGRLCRLITRGRRRAPKGSCHLELDDVLEHAEGLIAIALPPESDDPRGTARPMAEFERGLASLRTAFDSDRLFVALAAHHGADDERHLARALAVAHRLDLDPVATGDARMHTPERRMLLDVLTCIRAGCTVTEAGARLLPNAERRLASLPVVARRFEACPDAVRRSVELVERAASFSLDELDFRYPSETSRDGVGPFEELVQRTRDGARERYPAGIPAKVERLIEHEFALIAELEYAPYFLTVWDLVRFARSRGILCQGRGAAANSAVCYCLGVTAVDPERSELLFERFVSKERDEPPDIDVDFEHERREEVIQYLYRRHGRDHAALTAAITTYRGRGALRDVGKVLGLAPETIDTLAKGFDHWGELDDPERRIRDLGFDPKEPTLRWLVRLSSELRGLPRHMSQHVGGFVITQSPLCELVPIANAAMDARTTIEWDKDDLDTLGILKVDVLALGMLTCVRKCFDLVRDAAERAEDAPSATGDAGLDGTDFGDGNLGDGPRTAALGYDQPRDLTLSTIPAEDEAVYDMICRADTVGVFQIESRAQMSMLPRLRPRCFYDLVIEVAIVRPGPIQGDMVHPYLRRRTGEESVDYPSEEVRSVLERTLGVPIFQEQAMALSVVAAGFTPSMADQLRRAMGSWRKDATRLERLGARLVDGLLERGYSDNFAARLLKQIHGFGDYGFPESHAASFALIVYVSAWLKHHHPAAFAAALINSQPMGFYAPAQIVRDAREHRVEVRPIDVNASDWDCTIERSGGCGTPSESQSRGTVSTTPEASASGSTASNARAPEASAPGATASNARASDARAAHSPAPNAHASDPSAPDACAPDPPAPNTCAQGSSASNPYALGPHKSVPQTLGSSASTPYAAQSLASKSCESNPSESAPERSASDSPVSESRESNPRSPAGSGSAGGVFALRLGLRLAKGVAEEDARRIVAAVRLCGPFDSIESLWRVSGASVGSLRRLARADAFASFGIERERALWEIRALRPGDPAFADAAGSTCEGVLPFEVAESVAKLPGRDALGRVLADYSAAGLSLRGHPLGFLRPQLDELGAVRAIELADAKRLPKGRRVQVCGLVLVRQRPGTAAGIVFITLEDETGVANLIVRPRVFERDRRAARHAVCLLATGRVERQGEVVHVLVSKLESTDGAFGALGSRSRDFH